MLHISNRYQPTISATARLTIDKMNLTVALLNIEPLGTIICGEKYPRSLCDFQIFLPTNSDQSGSIFSKATVHLQCWEGLQNPHLTPWQSQGLPHLGSSSKQEWQNQKIQRC
jgi:hypothetical protein